MAAYSELIMSALVLTASGELTPSAGWKGVGGARGGVFFGGRTLRTTTRGEMPRGRGATGKEHVLPMVFLKIAYYTLFNKLVSFN